MTSNRKKLTIFFSDVVNFTETTEKLELEDLTNLEPLPHGNVGILPNTAPPSTNISATVMVFFGDRQVAWTEGGRASLRRHGHRHVAAHDSCAPSGRSSAPRSPIGINTGYCRRIAGIDADAHPEGLLGAELLPLGAQLMHAPQHGDGHAYAGSRVLLQSTRLWVAEEHHDRVTDIFVDGGAVFERDVRHFGEVAVQEVGQVLGFELLGGLGEIDHVGEEDGELLAVGGHLDALRAGEDGIVDLRREIFRQLGGERFKLLVLLGDHLCGGIQLPLVVIAEPHQPTRSAEQLLVALEQLLVM